MEMEQFDDFTRHVSAAGSSRRQALRLLGSMLFGGSLAGLATRLGLAEVTEAKPKKHGKRRHDERKDAGPIHAAAKHHNKHKHKGKHHDKPKEPPPLPPGCQHCGTCEMCQDGACVPDPDLDVVRCLDNADDPGGQCHVCQSGQCVPYSNGSVCNDGDECSWCQNGQCVPVSEKDLGPCGHGTCHLCDQGACVPAGNGTDCTDAQGDGVCCDQTCIHAECAAGERFDCGSGQCECDIGWKRCRGYCISADNCCEDDPYPYCGTCGEHVCDSCQEIVCDHGAWACADKCQFWGTVCCKGECIAPWATCNGG